MKKIIRDHKIVQDTWHILDITTETWKQLPATTQIIVPFDLWQTEHSNLLNYFTGGIGVTLENTTEPETISALDCISLLTIDFPLFSDGRGYSLARILREQLHYCGELRAVGDVLHDQLFYLSRCGFNAFDLKPHVNIEHALQAFNSFSRTYQPATA